MIKHWMTLGLAVMVYAWPAARAAADEPAGWASKMSFKGDLRLREEWIDEEGQDKERWRMRLRARLALKAEVNDTLDVHFRLASGGDDPASRNQSLGAGFSTKELSIGRAYFDWHPDLTPGLNIWGGKMANPFIVAKDLVWDSDVNPEGLAFKYRAGDDELALLANLGFFQVVERSSDVETYLYGGQLAGDYSHEDYNVVVGGSVYHYDNVKGFATVYEEGEGFGNDLIEITDPATGEVTETVYANDFNTVELFTVSTFDLGIPTRVYFDYVVNTEADDDDTGYMGGLTLGQAKEPRTMQFDYNYRDLEANAVIGALTDSDSGGGGTDVKGHRLQYKVQIARNWQAGVTVFLNKIDNGEKDYQRAQFDLLAKF